MLLSFFQSSALGLGASMFWRFLELQWSRCKAVRRGDFDQNISYSSFSSIFLLFIFFSLSPLPFLLPFTSSFSPLFFGN